MVRRRPSRERDGVSFGRRVPRFNIEAIRIEVQSESELLNTFAGELNRDRAKVVKLERTSFDPNMLPRGPVQ